MNKHHKITKTAKLKINQESIRTLSQRELVHVGGGEVFSIVSICIFNRCLTQ